MYHVLVEYTNTYYLGTAGNHYSASKLLGSCRDIFGNYMYRIVYCDMNELNARLQGLNGYTKWLDHDNFVKSCNEILRPT